MAILWKEFVHKPPKATRRRYSWNLIPVDGTPVRIDLVGTGETPEERRHEGLLVSVAAHNYAKRNDLVARTWMPAPYDDVEIRLQS